MFSSDTTKESEEVKDVLDSYVKGDAAKPESEIEDMYFLSLPRPDFDCRHQGPVYPV